MAPVGRPRIHPDDRTKWKENKRRQRRAAVAPHVCCRKIGSCTLYQCDWREVYGLLPKHAAVISDPPYAVRYDWTKARRRPSPWTQNFLGAD